MSSDLTTGVSNLAGVAIMGMTAAAVVGVTAKALSSTQQSPKKRQAPRRHAHYSRRGSRGIAYKRRKRSS